MPKNFRPQLGFIAEFENKNEVALKKYLSEIAPVDEALLTEAQNHCNQLAKPIGSLGKLETIYQRLFAIQQRHIDITNKGILIYVADNGICEENVSNNPQDITYKVARGMLEENATVSLLSNYYNNSYQVVDVGCLQDIEGAICDKISYGTKNFFKEAAMARSQAIQALSIGMRQAEQKIADGWQVIGTGEMGVGNTTTSTAILSVLLNLSPAEITGYGAGLSDQQLAHKIQIIEQALTLRGPFTDVLDLARKVGGYDILAMAGTFLACAHEKIPCVVDGLISMAGLLIACELAPIVLDYVFLSHSSAEPAFAKASQLLGISAPLQMEMRVGEGTGCPIFYNLLDLAVHMMTHLPKFEDLEISSADYIDISQNNLQQPTA